MDREGSAESGHICLVLSRAERSNVISASDTPVVVGTNLQGDASKGEGSLRKWIKLKCVNDLLVPKWYNRPRRIQPHI